MKRKIHFPASLWAIIVAIVFPGCKKALDVFATQEIAEACRIQKITYTGTFESLDSIMFTYDTYGNPVSAIRPNASTGYTNYLWRYDTYHRLTDQIDLYGVEVSADVPPEDWHRFFYDNKGRIAEDSQYFFPAIVGGRPVVGPFGGVRLLDYSYDNYDRLTGVTLSQNGSVVTTWDFTYDSHGNLTGQAYDDKINFHRSNKIWMFLSWDYSLNNPLTATYKYDRFGLPVTIDCLGENSAGLMNGIYGSLDFNQATIQYDCR